MTSIKCGSLVGQCLIFENIPYATYRFLTFKVYVKDKTKRDILISMGKVSGFLTCKNNGDLVVDQTRFVFCYVQKG